MSRRGPGEGSVFCEASRDRWVGSVTLPARSTNTSPRHSAGVPLEQVVDVLGHTDTRMLERVYRHPVTSSVAAAVEPMERLFGSA